MSKENKINLVAKALEATAKGAAEISANSRCAYIFHQPKMPKTVKKLRKF